MATALKTLFGDIANAIRSKTGDTATMKPIDFPTKILGIEVGGGATETDIFPEQDVAFSYFDAYGCFVSTYPTGTFTLVEGEEYKVLWGETVYPCTAFYVESMGATAIGNTAVIGGEDNGLPFAVGSDATGGVTFFAFEGTTTKVRIYQEVGGGSCDAVVWFVTFIGADGTKLYRMPVLDGDDCKDPYTRGDIEKPTKESTVSQVFTYSGWALTDGGSEQTTTALANVTEDRTVYAAFMESVRKYTIMFYDDDGTFLKSETLAYGATPSYTPEKAGHKFTGWTPEITAVVGEASYTANWIELVEFASAPWSYISELSESGQAEQMFNIGDKKAFEFNHGGTTYSVNAEIIAFNHDDKSDGSGKAGITLMVDVPTFAQKMNNADKTYAGSTKSYAGGYGNSDMRATLNGTAFNELPEEMRNVIKPVSKEWFNPTSETLKTTDEKLWLFSLTEFSASLNSSKFKYATKQTEGTWYKGIDCLRTACGATADTTRIGLRSGLARQGTTIYRDIEIPIIKPSEGTYAISTSPTATNIHALFGFCI